MFLPTAALVVEIVSPDDKTWEKLGFYAARGVDELLIVDPQERRVHWLGLQPGGDYRPLEQKTVWSRSDQPSWPSKSTGRTSHAESANTAAASALAAYTTPSARRLGRIARMNHEGREGYLGYTEDYDEQGACLWTIGCCSASTERQSRGGLTRSAYLAQLAEQDLSGQEGPGKAPGVRAALRKLDRLFASVPAGDSTAAIRAARDSR